MTRSEAIKDLVTANHILSNEGVFDAFGHVSMRDPENDQQFLLSISKAPQFVKEEDIQIYDFDGNIKTETVHKSYAERIMHAQIYKARPDVNAICHNHATALLPFTSTNTEIKPIAQVGCIFYEGIPLFDGVETSYGLLITTKPEGESIARALGDKRALLLRGHGVVVVGSGIREAVVSSIYLPINAEIQYKSMKMGDPKYLTYEEGKSGTDMMFSDLVLERVWDYWKERLKKE